MLRIHAAVTSGPVSLGMSFSAGLHGIRGYGEWHTRGLTAAWQRLYAECRPLVQCKLEIDASKEGANDHVGFQDCNVSVAYLVACRVVIMAFLASRKK